MPLLLQQARPLSAGSSSSSSSSSRDGAPRLSIVAGPVDVPLVNRTVDGVLASAVARGAQHTALVVPHQGVRLTFEALDAAAGACARALLARGLVPGDRVGIWAPNCVEWVITMFGAARAGLILVNLNPAYRPRELAHALRLTGCAGLVYAATDARGGDFGAILGEIAGDVAAAGCRMLVRIGPGGVPPGAPVVQFEALLAEGARAAHLAAPAPSDVHAACNIQFTSGTTGLPKGATLSHYNIVNNAAFVGAALGLTPSDVVCIPVPLYHCFGMVMGVLAAVHHGATSLLPCAAFDAGAVLAAVTAERATALYGVPTMFIGALQHPDFHRADLRSLRTGIMAGAPCPVAVMRSVVADMHCREMTICYGMTETSPVSFQSALDDSLERRVSTVGRVHPHVEVMAVDASGVPVPRGVPGELLTRGYSVMRGYWGEPEKTAAAIDAAGWMHTGDLGTIDEEGYCSIVGRLKDVIIRGGENIAPREVEELLHTHPALADVAVVGVPDGVYGEVVVACVRLRPGASATAEEVREFCKGRISHFKVRRRA